MATRGLYFAREGKVFCKLYNLPWNLGFDREAKHRYFENAKKILGDSYGRIAEVTSSAENWHTRQLSPIFMRSAQNPDLMLEDYLRSLLPTIPNLWELTALVDWFYITSLSDDNLKIAHAYDAYSDIFGNPERGWGNSQAESLAVMRALEQQNRCELICNYEGFVDWYYGSLSKEFI